MLPKILHLFWGGERLSYLQYLTVVSFKKHNPDWRVWLWRTDSPSAQAHWPTGEQELYEGKDFLRATEKNCKVKTINDLAIRPVHTVQQSDIARGRILFEHGGVWSDFDILFIRSIKSLGDADIYLCNPYIGFLIAKPKQEFFDRWSWIGADLVARNMSYDYQSTGRYAVDRALSDTEARFEEFPVDMIYPYGPDDIEELFFGDSDKTTPQTIGIHWYNGHPLAKKYQNNFEQYRHNKSVISKYIKDYDA